RAATRADPPRRGELPRRFVASTQKCVAKKGEAEGKLPGGYRQGGGGRPRVRGAEWSYETRCTPPSTCAPVPRSRSTRKTAGWSSSPSRFPCVSCVAAKD